MSDVLIDETIMTAEQKLRFLQWAANRVCNGKMCRLRPATWCYPCWQRQPCREHYENATREDNN